MVTEHGAQVTGCVSADSLHIAELLCKIYVVQLDFKSEGFNQVLSWVSSCQTGTMGSDSHKAMRGWGQTVEVKPSKSH